MLSLLPLLVVGCKGKDSDSAVSDPSSPPSFRPYVSAPSSILPDDLSACSVIADQQCEGGNTQECTLFDTTEDDWAITVEPMTEQAFWFDRYFDLYHQANGLSMDLDFTQAVPAGTPESVWSSDAYFRSYDGRGDASGWTGTALWGAAARYAVTGTETDYERMLQKAEAMGFLYEVTGVPGLLARSHFAMLEEGAPDPVGHWNKSIFRHSIGDGSDGPFEFVIDPALHDRLPDYYLDGVEIDGSLYATTPILQSDASRDMYVRSLPGFMLAYDLLGEGAREDAVRDVVRSEIPCTLNRMKKGRIINLQQSTEILEAMTTYFNGPGLHFDEGDLDFQTLDTLIFYTLEQPHPQAEELFDPTCPDGPPMDFDPELELDAADDEFLLNFLQLALRETRQSDFPIAWSMHVSVRASDTLFMTQWALTAHALTGDERYLDFLDQMMNEVDYWGVLNTYGALQLPKWCASHYGPSLGYPSLYNTLARIDREESPDYWEAMASVAYLEARLKENEPRQDPFFGLLYSQMVTPAVDPTMDDYVAESVALLSTYGMNPEDKLEPDRSYPRDFVNNPDPEVPLEEIAPGDPEWELCENPITVMGIQIPAPDIDGIPIRSVDPLPLDQRIGGTFLWQMDPWMVQRTYGGVGMDTQWPMLGLFTPYWVGRMDGVITEGTGLALAWKDTGEPCEE